jgi:hypothetical protein
MTTLGYNYTPATGMGKFTTVLSTITGIFLETLFVVTILENLSLSHYQEVSLNYMQKRVSVEEEKHAAASFIQEVSGERPRAAIASSERKEGCPSTAETGERAKRAGERSEREEGVSSAAEVGSLSELKEDVSFCRGSGLAQRRRVLLRRKRARSKKTCPSAAEAGSLKKARRSSAPQQKQARSRKESVCFFCRITHPPLTLPPLSQVFRFIIYRNRQEKLRSSMKGLSMVDAPEKFQRTEKDHQVAQAKLLLEFRQARRFKLLKESSSGDPIMDKMTSMEKALLKELVNQNMTADKIRANLGVKYSEDEKVRKVRSSGAR